MREYKITCDKFDFTDILDVTSRKAVNEHASFYIRGRIAADTDEYRKANDTRAVKKTLSIPAWLNRRAETANAPFSQILQQGLKEYLRIAE